MSNITPFADNRQNNGGLIVREANKSAREYDTRFSYGPHLFAQTLERVVCSHVSGVTLRDLRAPGAYKRPALARKICMYFLYHHPAAGRPRFNDVAKAYRRAFTPAFKAVAFIEAQVKDGRFHRDVVFAVARDLEPHFGPFDPDKAVRPRAKEAESAARNTDIREMYADGMTVKRLARGFRLSDRRVKAIVAGCVFAEWKART